MERGRLWPTFKELKDAGKKPYWRAEKLFAGSVYTPPTSNFLVPRIRGASRGKVFLWNIQGKTTCC